MPMVPELLLQLRDGLFQRHDLLRPLLILMQPVRDLVCAAKHIGASTLVQLRQCGHQATHPILHHLLRTGPDSRNNRCLCSLVFVNALIHKSIDRFISTLNSVIFSSLKLSDFPP